MNNYTKIVDVYDPAINTWSFSSALLSPANLSSALAANNCIYVLGGYTGIIQSRVSKYDPFTDTWYIRSEMQKARSMFGTAFANNCIYVFGGLNVFPLSSVEEYRLVQDPKNIPVR